MPLDSTTQITVNVGAFACRVWDEGTVNLSIERDGFNTRGITHWRCAYEDALPLAQALLGGSKNLGATTVFQNGFSCAAFYGLAAQRINIHADGVISQDGSTGFATFERQVLDIEFGYDSFAAGDATTNSSELQMSYSLKTYPLDMTTFTFKDSDGNIIMPSNASDVTVAIGTFTKVLYYRGLINGMAFLPFINTVNINPVTFPSIGPGAPSTTIPKGQLYFAGPHTRTKLTPQGLPSFDIFLDFQYHPVADGWNSVPTPSGWKKKLDNGGNPEFAYTDHNQLLRDF